MDGLTYESEGPSEKDVISIINDTWICKQLNLSENTYEETQKLKNLYNTTFDEIRFKNPQWNRMLVKIIEEEVIKGKGQYDSFGSYRGYYTFIHKQITNNVEERVIREIWLPYYLNNKVSTLYRIWIRNRFAPGGKGYQEAMDDFNTLKNKYYITK